MGMDMIQVSPTTLSPPRADEPCKCVRCACFLLFVFRVSQRIAPHNTIRNYWHGALETAEFWPACSQILSNPYLLLTKRYWLLILSCLLSILHSATFSVFTHPGRDDVLCDLVNRYVLELKPTFITHALYYWERYSTHTLTHASYRSYPILDPGSHFRLPGRPSNFAFPSDINFLGLDKGGSQ